ncbi:hypothetical protein [Sphingomonas ursincola]|uniref:hypothetical protein n=1 Tax=Sphingomonas ursincola TaxID=56361 RepID=UPI002356B512|nr:hypothetical protein [Sphingomonas ursincola]MBY0618440.1 hypothetical protein [Sphingomonas ursincola]
MTHTQDSAPRCETTPPLDCTGRPIMVGDVLKVFHFVGARRKRHFMFKQVVGTKVLGPSGKPYLLVSHLNMKDPEGPDGGYYLAQDGEMQTDTEIVQGIDWHHDRPRATLRTDEGDE